jgi:oligoendopeptidase F
MKKRASKAAPQKEIKDTWDLSLLFKSEKDPRIEEEVAAAERAIDAFARKYEKDAKLATPARLAQALADYEALARDAKAS